MIKFTQHIAIIPLSLSLLAIAIITCIALLSFTPQVRALPEFADRTNVACSGCHVSPGGGGPLNLGGMAWVSSDRPDNVPQFEAVLLAPGVTDAALLYKIGCTGCHGDLGEGLSASRLSGFSFSKSLIRRSIIEGLPYFNMPAFKGQFTDEQVQILAAYVSDLSAGRIVPSGSYPLPPGELRCSPTISYSFCGGN